MRIESQNKKVGDRHPPSDIGVERTFAQTVPTALWQSNPAVFSIKDFCRTYSIGRTKAFELIAAGQLRAHKCGRRTLISIDDAKAWFEALPTV